MARKEARSESKRLRMPAREMYKQERMRKLIEASACARPPRSAPPRTGLPSVADAPRNARIIESAGPFAVALVYDGEYLGLHRKEGA